MASTLIMYEDDHKGRAQALEVSMVAAARACPIDERPKVEAGLKTLIFWGHGDENALCGKSSDEIFRLIRAWQNLNDGIDTIEILTCNSAHWRPKLNKADRPRRYFKSRVAHLVRRRPINDSFNKQVKRSLKYSGNRALKAITVKGMPFSDQTGHKGAVSILLWDKDTLTWAFVPGGTLPGNADKIMFQKKTVITQGLNPPPFQPDKPWEWFSDATGSLTQRLASGKIAHAQLKRSYTVTRETPDEARIFMDLDFSDCKSGTITDLRDALVVIN